MNVVEAVTLLMIHMPEFVFKIKLKNMNEKII